MRRLRADAASVQYEGENRTGKWKVERMNNDMIDHGIATAIPGVKGVHTKTRPCQFFFYLVDNDAPTV